MTRLILVRHGEAAAAWSDAPDPGLSALGQRQAKAVADAIGQSSPMAIVSSPLQRARETAMPLEALWRQTAAIEPGVAEVPSSHTDAEARTRWLDWFLSSRWSDIDAHLQDWRAGVLEALQSMNHDAVIFTHFVAINVAVGAATESDDVLCFRPGNCSRTVVEVNSTGLTLVSRGDEGVTKVNLAP